jgi:uncharacterized membrane protein
MIASGIYYLLLRNMDWSFGRKFSIGILLVYVMYYMLYYNVFANQIYSTTYLWLIVIDIFVLGVLLMKYKNLKWSDFMGTAAKKIL